MAQRMYECMFLLDSGRYATDPQGTENAVREILGRCRAEIIALGPWQDGKLAYPIEGHRKGLHYLAYYRMDGSQADELTRLCKLSELVIRQMVIVHQNQPLFERMVELLRQHGSGHPEPEPEPAPVAVAAGAEDGAEDAEE